MTRGLGIGVRVVAVSFLLAAGIAIGSVVTQVTTSWERGFPPWQLLWWLFVGVATGIAASRLTEDTRFADSDIGQSLGRCKDIFLMGLGILAVGGTVLLLISSATAPFFSYWPLPIGATLVMVPTRPYVQLREAERELSSRRAREREIEGERVQRLREASTRWREASPVQKTEYENRFLQALYLEAGRDIRRVKLDDVWRNLGEEFAPEMAEHVLKVWDQRGCIEVNDIPYFIPYDIPHVDVYDMSSGQYVNEIVAKRRFLSLTASGRDLCMVAEQLDSMEEALSTRGEGHVMSHGINVYGGQGHIIGQHVEVHDNQFTQVTNTASTDGPRLEDLAGELAQLKAELFKRAAQEDRVPQDLGMIDAVSRAETAARDGDSQGVWRQLAGAGKQALVVAEQIGISVAAEAITKAIGI